MPRRAPPPPSSTLLLPHLPPSLTLPVHHFPHRTTLRPSPRTLQLRASTIVLTRRDDPTAVETALHLSHAAAPRRTTRATASLHAHRLRFASEPHLAAFLAACTAALSALSPGRAAYHVVRELARGAEAPVYLALRRRDSRALALKAVPKRARAPDSAFGLRNVASERVALAAAAASRARFLVRLVDAFETDRHLCFVTELASYGDLHSVFDRLSGARVGQDVVRGVFAEIVLGLEELHRMGYLYRDMKLGNVLLTASGHVRLADFGLAKRVEVEEVDASAVSSESDGEDVATAFRVVGRANSMVGTKRYMSPEHFFSGHPQLDGYGAPADVWALGVVLYVMLTGEYPVGRDVCVKDTSKVFKAIREEEIEYPEWMGAEVVELLQKMFERDSKQRIDIFGIKAHPWMKGIDWEKLKTDAENDAPREDVLALMKENGIEMIEDIRGEAVGSKDMEGFSKVSASGVEDENNRRKRIPSTQLLGFGYLNVER